jgi:hypothetical protein
MRHSNRSRRSLGVVSVGGCYRYLIAFPLFFAAALPPPLRVSQGLSSLVALGRETWAGTEQSASVSLLINVKAIINPAAKSGHIVSTHLGCCFIRFLLLP